MWLPHEIIAVLDKESEGQLLSAQNLDKVAPMSKAHLEYCAQQLNCNPLGLGLWIDGVPLNKNRSESIEVFSLNIVGIEDLRLPWCVVPKKHMLKDRSTHDEILKVFKWSMEQLALGVHPAKR